MEQKVNYDAIFESETEMKYYIAENWRDMEFWQQLKERLLSGDKKTIFTVIRVLKDIAPELKILREINKFYADYYYCSCGTGLQGGYYIP